MIAVRGHRVAVFFPLAFALAALAATGCHGCRDAHPYVPYRIGPVEPAAQAASAPDSGLPGAPLPPGDPFAAQEAMLAPPGTSSWDTDNLTLQAPDGLVFVSAVVGDFNGDGAPEAFAIARPNDGNDPGEGLYYRSASQGSVPVIAATFAPPAGLSRDATCEPIDRLVGLGRRSAFIELGTRCSQSAGSAPVRWVAVVDGGANPAVRLAATVADPVGAPDLSVDASVADRDKDGRDDVALRVSLEGGGAPLEPGPHVSAILA